MMHARVSHAKGQAKHMSSIKLGRQDHQLAKETGGVESVEADEKLLLCSG